MSTLTVTLTDAERAALDRLAAAANQPPEEVLRGMIRRAEHEASADEPVPPGESLYDALMRSGVIGSIDSGVPDLGTDHERHLREIFRRGDA
jgi:hypothetical protein